MKKILIIAQHEFLAVVFSKAYIFLIIALPLALGLMLSVLQSKTFVEDSVSNKGAVGVVDQTGLLNVDSQKKSGAAEPLTQSPGDSTGLKTTNIRSYENVGAGLGDLQRSTLDILYVIGPKFLLSGEIDVYGRETRHLRGNAPTGYESLGTNLRAGLIRKLLPENTTLDRLPSDLATRLILPPKLNKLSVGEDGAVGPMRNPWERISIALAPLSVAFLLGLSVFLSSGSLLEATVEENKNRVMELLLSAVRVEQLIWGKVLGLCGAGLLQVFLYLALISLATSYLWVGVNISFATLAIYSLYWMLGHLLYAGLLLATGIVLGGERSSNQLAFIWLFTALFPLLFAEALLSAPNGILARALSYIPLTSPIAMVFRMAKTSVPLVDIFVSLVLLMAAIYLVMRGAAKILRTGALMYGKRITLPEVARWLREA